MGLAGMAWLSLMSTRRLLSGNPGLPVASDMGGDLFIVKGDGGTCVCTAARGAIFSTDRARPPSFIQGLRW